MAATKLSRVFLNVPIIVKARSVTRNLFQRHLLLTNLGISAGLSGVGDSLQQHYEIIKSDQRKFDFRRTVNMSVTGLSIGTVCHYWYIWLDKVMPGRTLAIAFKKMLLDQLICSPVTIATFFITLAIVEKNSFKEFYEEFKSKSWRLYVAEWVIWPPAQMLNFFFLPTQYRVLFDNIVSTLYDIYTSYVKHELPIEAECKDNESDLHVPVRTSGHAISHKSEHKMILS